MPYKDKKKQKQAVHEHYIRNKDKFASRLIARRARNRKIIQDIKSNNCCSICGENRSICLDFHHKHNKITNVTSVVNKAFSVDNIMSEIDKCEILCSNCHMKLHRKLITDGKHWNNISEAILRKRKWFIDFIQKQKCCKCEESDYRCLVFHHIYNKKHNISNMLNSGHSLLTLQEEISKCIILCGNCHRILHKEQVDT